MTKEEILAAIDSAIAKANSAKNSELFGMSPSRERDMVESGFNGAIAALTLLHEGFSDAG